MRATQLTHIGIDQSPIMTDQSITIRTRWNSATTAKITPATRENVFASTSRHPKFRARWHVQAKRQKVTPHLAERLNSLITQSDGIALSSPGKLDDPFGYHCHCGIIAID